MPGKPIIKEEKVESFMHFFKDPQESAAEGEGDDDDGDLYQRVDDDFELGLTFREKVCACACGHAAT